MLIYVKLLLTAFFWGGTFIAGRAIAGQVGPWSAAFLRFALASLCLLGLLIQREGRLPTLRRQHLLAVILLGITGVFSYNILFFKGLELINAGRAALIIALNPIVITLFSACLFNDRLNLAKITGVLVSVAGALVVISRGQLGLLLSGQVGWGELFIVGCVLSWAAFSIVGKIILTSLTPLASITYASLVGTLCLLPPAFSEGVLAALPTYRAVDWFSLVYLGLFGTVAGFMWYYEGIQRIGPARASLFINFVPISAVVLAYLILHEPLTPSLLIGVICVSCGMYLTNTGGFRFPPRVLAAGSLK